MPKCCTLLHHLQILCFVQIHWVEFLSGAFPGMTDDTVVTVMNPTFFEDLATLLTNTDERWHQSPGLLLLIRSLVSQSKIQKLFLTDVNLSYLYWAFTIFCYMLGHMYCITFKASISFNRKKIVQHIFNPPLKERDSAIQTITWGVVYCVAGCWTTSWCGGCSWTWQHLCCQNPTDWPRSSLIWQPLVHVQFAMFILYIYGKTLLSQQCFQHFSPFDWALNWKHGKD